MAYYGAGLGTAKFEEQTSRYSGAQLQDSRQGCVIDIMLKHMLLIAVQKK